MKKANLHRIIIIAAVTFYALPSCTVANVTPGLIFSDIKSIAGEFLSSHKVASKNHQSYYFLNLPVAIQKKLNIFVLEDDYAELLDTLQCSNITAASQGGVYRCEMNPDSYYIKFPRDYENFDASVIKSVVGGKLYEAFLEEKTENFPNQGAVLSQEIKNFTSLEEFFNHFFLYYDGEFYDTLLFSGDHCIPDEVLGRWCIDKKTYSIIERLRFEMKIMFQMRIERGYVECAKSKNEPLDYSQLKYISCNSERTLKPIIGFDELFLATFLLDNHDLNFRNMGLIDKGDHYKVFTVDYDSIGSNYLRNKEIYNAIAILLKFNRLGFYFPKPKDYLQIIPRFQKVLARIDADEFALDIAESLPGIPEDKIIEVLSEVFNFPKSHKQNSLSQQLFVIVHHLLPEKLRGLESYIIENKCVRCK